MLYGLAIIIGLLEGLTEFIPVSSTGHMIIAGHMLHFTGERADAFEIFIQLGAILAVAFLYRDRFLGLITGRAPAGSPTERSPSDLSVEHRPGNQRFAGMRGLLLLGITTAPALVFGKLFHHAIKEKLFSPLTVAIGLAIGGAGLILIEVFKPRARVTRLDDIGIREAIWVGLFQCFALWPGMSRSGSTIIGGMLMGVDRKTTAEYSFLAAVPVMIAATGFDLYKSREFLSASDAPLFALGFVVALVSAWFAVRFFIGFLGKHTLKGFGWYRLALAAFTWWYFSR